MTTDDERHTPTTEFRERLEVEVSRALRHEQRASELRWSRWPNMRTVARLAAAILIGVVVGAAPAQVADARQRDSLLVSANAELRLLSLRLEMAREDVERQQKLFQTGVISERELREAERELRTLEIALTRVQRNIEETRATSRPPRDDIAAPVVGDRDYVRERLILELRAREQDLSEAERRTREIEQRVRTGVETQVAQAAAETERVRLRTELELLAGKLRLREQVVAGRAAPDSAESQLRLLELEQRLQLHSVRLRTAAERLERVKSLFEAGVVTRRELLRAEFEVVDLQAEIELLQFQLRRAR